MNALAKRLIALGASSVIAVSGVYLVEPWEGSSNQAYKDMVGVPTLCHGYTVGVKMGDYKTDEECEEILAKELTHFNTQMKKSVKVPLPEHMEVAYTSLVWNIGVGAWNSSTLLKKLNNKEYAEACKQILRWNKSTFNRVGALKQQKNGETCTQLSNGYYSCTVKGLTNRREAEYKVCMGENADVNKALQELSVSNEEPLSVGNNGLRTIENEVAPPTPQLEEITASSPHKSPTTAIPESVCTKKFLFWCFKYGSL